jgi:hypothetical protein
MEVLFANKQSGIRGFGRICDHGSKKKKKEARREARLLG